MPTTMAQKGMFGFIVLLAGFFLVIGPLAFLFAGSDDWEPTAFERGMIGIVPIVAGVMILTGLFIMKQSPRLGAGLLSGGAIVMALLWYWLFLIGIPVVIFMIWYGVTRARQVGRNRSPPGADA